MGAVCCIASRDKNIHHGASGEFLHRNFRHSPTWSFRWDNRVGVVVGEEPSSTSLSDVANRTATSDGGSSLDSYQTSAWRKSPLNPALNKSLKASNSGQSAPTNACTEVKQYAEFSQVSNPSLESSPPIHTSSITSPPSSWAQGPPAHHLAHEASDTHSSGTQSPNMSPQGSSYAWSAHAFSELMSMSASQRDHLSIDSETLTFSHDKSSQKRHNSRSFSVDLQTCGICSNLLSEKSAWSSQTIIEGTELSVVSVLICGHVFHAECLEAITPEIHKYDPVCPVCTLGEKQTLKLAGKMVNAEKDLKAKSSTKSRNHVGDSNASFDFDYWKRSGDTLERKNPELVSSSSLKISSAKPFLKRHFSLGLKGNKSSESSSIKKKGLFWAKSSRF